MNILWCFEAQNSQLILRLVSFPRLVFEVIRVAEGVFEVIDGPPWFIVANRGDVEELDIVFESHPEASIIGIKVEFDIAASLLQFFS